MGAIATGQLVSDGNVVIRQCGGEAAKGDRRPVELGNEKVRSRINSTLENAYQFEVLNATDEIRCVWPPTLDIHTVFKRKRNFKTIAFTFKGTKTGPVKATV